MIYIFDIETRPDQKLLPLFTENIKPDSRLKDPIKRKADVKAKSENPNYIRKSMSLDSDYADVLCVGIKPIGEEGKIYTIEELVTWFEEKMEEAYSFVTFNGKLFDLPIIIKAGTRKGLHFPYGRLTAMTKKYNTTNGHLDLMELLAFGGKQKSLDTYLRIYCGTQKETLGDDFFQNATEDEIKKHCLEDLQYTEMLFEKFKYLVR